MLYLAYLSLTFPTLPTPPLVWLGVCESAWNAKNRPSTRGDDQGTSAETTAKACDKRRLMSVGNRLGCLSGIGLDTMRGGVKLQRPPFHTPRLPRFKKNALGNYEIQQFLLVCQRLARPKGGWILQLALPPTPLPPHTFFSTKLAIQEIT